ncbi:MAG: hypothetical protein JWR69_4490, partial [Pedosphaera sp.]|nr:hypothetical protein [Pedosphaera sp.]
VMRFHHYSLRTEEADWQWIKRFTLLDEQRPGLKARWLRKGFGVACRCSPGTRRALRESDGGRWFGLPRVALGESGNQGLRSATGDVVGGLKRRRLASSVVSTAGE